MNNVILTGNITRDAEIKSFTARGTGEPFNICNFSIAVNKAYPHQNDVDYFNCRLTGKRATTLAQYLLKGKPINVKGRLETYKTESSTYTYILCEDVEFQRGQAAKQAPMNDIPSDYFGDEM